MSATVEQIEYVSIERAIPMRRVWAMPSGNTFDIAPIGALVKQHLYAARVSIDPFARNKRWATHTNDLNPETAAEHHMDALEFLKMLKTQGVRAQCTIFDPPYSPRQVKELYDSIGLKTNVETAWRTHAWTPERDLIDGLMDVGGIVISCGWDSGGMGVNRPYKVEEILLVAHGAGHNDTIVTVERKVENKQISLIEG